MRTNFYKPIIGLGILLLTISCKVEPEAIDYGKDQCSFCVMNIVDKTHATQYVTKKGKQFKFDAIECMVNDLVEKNEEDLAILLVSNYANPGEMIDAKTASYLISTAIKSPMGANLSGVSSIEKAEELQQKYSGEIYTWQQLKQRLSDK
ncbi:nitrous oxide reductase accessory protein NosL [Lutibacter sp.]|uniref:nitrous oxide reductase accessory protein NosL n=1 Tax=Lutibacter sp. TaxID=1925666 RepID=UPI001A1C2097|nr:nitrous oxide reductase accessory protein NosL [Lutibacter sp.]MBI9040060.1 nitrous oxide reductase accessory protein NosL [Lutibacter sp.]